MLLRVLFFTMALTAAASAARAEISFETETGNRARIFGSGMVLQRRATVPVWGTSDTGASIQADFVNPSAAPGSEIVQSRSTAATAAGRWVVRFEDLPVGGPYELRFREGGEASPSVVLTDVLVGDVWLASGQSNMVIRLPRDGDEAAYPQVRAITFSHWGQRPSGAAFYFGARLFNDLGIPIGLVNRAQADTALAHWLPAEVADDADPQVAALFPGCGGEPAARCLYYNAHIRPLERPVEVGEPREAMALRGVVWWQGEKGYDKVGTAAYEWLFPAMVRAWRSNLGQPDLPFVYHQMPSGTGLRWSDSRARSVPRRYDVTHWQARQRIAFFRLLAPKTTLMSSIDLDSGTHPRAFDAYGARLGEAALGTTYVQAGDVAPHPYSGAIYESASLEPVPGGPDEVRIRFRANTADGLQIGPSGAPPATVLQGFGVCCNGAGAFVFADARIDNGSEVVVSDPEVETPTAVHYAIGRNARWANLFNGMERGTAPFSTELSDTATHDPDGDGFWEPGPYTE
ncbi:MAG: sialate O-acetylesterase [Candidatus Binatia bacterium]